ncbi:MAG TPA: hypothetical protein VFR03_15700 [Thermoanaerobaculia bacterium]|nr:hypothetical protein [Thermoanaerobaculia bacterium]
MLRMTRVVLWAAVLGGAVLLAVVGMLVTAQYRFIARLKRELPATWQSLGCPSPLLTHFEHVAAFHRFLLEREYRSLGDEELISAAERLRALTRATYALGAGVLVLMGLAKVMK